MAQALEFVGNHPFLFTALLVILALMALNELWRWRNAQPRLAPTEAVRLINSDNARVIDVRASGEFEGGHIVNARNIPQDRLDEHLKELLKRRKKPVLLYCGNGLSAPRVAARLVEAGMEQVYVLKGGLQNWQQAGLPITRKSRE